MKAVFRILSLFIIAQLLGLYTGAVILHDFQSIPEIRDMQVQEDQNAPFYFMAYVILGAVFLIFLIRYFRETLLFQLIEFFVISSASSVVFYSILRLLFPFLLSIVAAIGIGLIFGALRLFFPQLKNPAAILATAGVGAIFGTSMGILSIFIFIVLLAIYDYIAVVFTKHMVEMAQFIIKKEIAFTITAKQRLPTGKESRIDLGTGDIIVPIMVEVALLPLSPFASLFVMGGAVFALFILFTFIWKKRMVLPAIPPLFIGMLLFFLIGRLVGLY